MSQYTKYCYWVDLPGLKTARKNLEEKEIQLTDEARIPCRGLRPSVEIGYVAPPAWNGVCKRKTSWYSKSKRANQFLIVSNTPLSFPAFENPVVIVESDFKPERFPTSEEIYQLVELQEFQARKPRSWDKTDPLETDFYRRWFDRLHVREPFDFDQLFRIHSANHANFLEPRGFVTENGVRVPYSIADSIHVCSSCLEFFNILGEQWPLKYVVPCIGAVQFAHLPLNRYFEVRTPI